jgi:hypothetical protein
MLRNVITLSFAIHFNSEVLKIIRNQEAHDLNVKKEKSKIVACFITGLSITFALYKMVRKGIGRKPNDTGNWAGIMIPLS